MELEQNVPFSLSFCHYQPKRFLLLEGTYSLLFSKKIKYLLTFDWGGYTAGLESFQTLSLEIFERKASL
jgi:hypothetical protein